MLSHDRPLPDADRILLLSARVSELERTIDDMRSMLEQRDQDIAHLRSTQQVLIHLNGELRAATGRLNQENNKLAEENDLLKRMNGLLSERTIYAL